MTSIRQENWERPHCFSLLASQQCHPDAGELLEQRAEAGPHLMLDIDCVSPAPQPGAATPLSEIQLQTLFGTTQPTKAMIQSAEQDGRLNDLCKRWQAVYLTVYEEGQPVEYVFIGVSGD